VLMQTLGDVSMLGCLCNVGVLMQCSVVDADATVTEMSKFKSMPVTISVTSYKPQLNVNIMLT